MASHSTCSFFFDTEALGGHEPSRRVTLDACSLCLNPLATNCDIFMYRGDTPFCSVECRYEQMQMDAISARLVKPVREGSQRRQEAPASGCRKVSGFLAGGKCDTVDQSKGVVS